VTTPPFPLADPDNPSHELFLGAALPPARANPSIDAALLSRLEAALVRVSQVTPDATGIAGPASWSGPGATGWERTVAHPKRGPAFAEEIITAAALCGHRWPAGNADSVELTITGGIDPVDFGIKLLAGHKRRTVEADVLIQSPDGIRAVDVKFATDGRYRGDLTAGHAAGIASVIDRGEITSFHFVTPGRFSPDSGAPSSRSIRWSP
jgi:hypothetical protein